jgi:hypothetical protein
VLILDAFKQPVTLGVTKNIFHTRDLFGGMEWKWVRMSFGSCLRGFSGE